METDLPHRMAHRPTAASLWCPAARQGLIRFCLALLLVVGLGACGQPFDQPTAGSVVRPWARVIPASPPRGAIHEVAPPATVLALSRRLDRYSPTVTIRSPRDGSPISGDSLELRLEVGDWPLIDAGALGLGPHLGLLVDERPLQRLTDIDGPIRVKDLSPGSHRIRVFAMRPWGEAVQSVRAYAEITVHRLGETPERLAAPAAPELLVVAPPARISEQPVLLDWLLRNAPLQNLETQDGRWRLKITINGESFLVDRSEPLWLEGLNKGENAIRLALLDGQGQPLEPRFNSRLLAVALGPAKAAEPLARLLRGELSEAELDALTDPLQPLPPRPAGQPQTAAPSRRSRHRGTAGRLETPQGTASGETRSGAAAEGLSGRDAPATASALQSTDSAKDHSEQEPARGDGRARGKVPVVPQPAQGDDAAAATAPATTDGSAGSVGPAAETPSSDQASSTATGDAAVLPANPAATDTASSSRSHGAGQSSDAAPQASARTARPQPLQQSRRLLQSLLGPMLGRDQSLS